MPGYAYVPPTVNVAQDTTPAISVAKEKTFYGFDYNNQTGRLRVEKIGRNSGTAIKIPQANTTDDTAYKHWVWNENDLKFSWSSDHLILEVK